MILVTLALCACGGGGGGGGGALPSVVAASPPVQTPAVASAAPGIADRPPAPTQTQAVTPLSFPTPENTGCTVALDGHIECPLIEGDSIGVGVPAGSYVRYTNNTGQALQINQVQAETDEVVYWSEYCVYLNVLVTGSTIAGTGETNCVAKAAGQNYAPLTWGQGLGLSVPPGAAVYLNSHTAPALENHTYTMSVVPQTSGVWAWRQPQQDVVNACDGAPQTTPWTPWQNTTGAPVYVPTVSVYAQPGPTAAPGSMSACAYVLNADGTVNAQVCGLSQPGEVTLNLTLQPGQWLSGQAQNICAAPAVWGWAAYFSVW